MSHKHLILASLLFVLFVGLSHSQDQSDDLCHPHDKNVLLRIKKHLGNPSSLSSWDPNTDCVVWNRIQCNIEGHVTMVRIEEAEDIYGPIPPLLDQLLALTDLFFVNIPHLLGPIPSYIGKLTNLTAFTISHTNVTGPIPKFLGQLTNMNQLDLLSNKFTGPIPNFLGRLKSLTYLDLSSNLLTGQIPIALGQLTNIQILLLSSNKLSGQMPNFIAQKLKNLAVLHLDFNSLSGLIPTELGFMPELQTLGLAGNQFSGPIPKSLGRNLNFLYLSQNKLTGDASFLFQKANTNILIIEVAYNLLKFDFTNVYLNPNLSFNISHNMIYGSLPKEFGRIQPDSDPIDVSYNQLCGPIPNGRRFKRVDPARFAHNKCLCGGPFPGCE